MAGKKGKSGGHRHGNNYGVSDRGKKSAKVPRSLPNEYLEEAWLKYIKDTYGVNSLDELTEEQWFEIDPDKTFE
jgi:hypothetical protein